MSAPEAAEVARRVRAARAYSKLSREALSKAIGFHPSTLDEMEGKRKQLRGASWEELWSIADACQLPREWFSADLSRLHEIVPADQPRFEANPRAAGQRAADAAQVAAQKRRERPEHAPASRPDRDAPETRR